MEKARHEDVLTTLLQKNVRSEGKIVNDLNWGKVFVSWLKTKDQVARAMIRLQALTWAGTPSHVQLVFKIYEELR